MLNIKATKSAKQGCKSDKNFFSSDDRGGTSRISSSTLDSDNRDRMSSQEIHELEDDHFDGNG